MSFEHNGTYSSDGRQEHDTRFQTITVVIASVGRPLELKRWIDHLALQTLAAFEMIWAISSDQDAPQPIPPSAIPLRVVRSAKGLTTQRNAALDALSETTGLVAFFDDDYVPTTTCLEDIARAFALLPEVSGLTGTLLADGINGPGITYEDAARLIEDHENQARTPSLLPSFHPTEGLYGCNMIYRLDRIGDARFDEKLPLYGWQEDVDFANRIANGHPIGKTDAFVGVHQGTKGGRTSGKKLGYSQIVNPLYLYRKGSLSGRKALRLAVNNFLANHIKFFRPESWVDRRGRAAGNWIGLVDAVRGQVDPLRATRL